MQVRPEALDTALAKKLPAVVWVHGDEPLLLQESADAARRAFKLAGHVERDVFHVDRSFSAAALDAAASAMSLFASRKLIEVRFPAKAGAEIGQGIADTVGRLADDVRLLITSARMDRKTTESAWFIAIDRRALIVPVYPVDRGQLPAWIAQRLAAQGQRAGEDTLALIAERVEGNLLAAHQEIQKLGLLFAAGDLPADPVRAAVLNVARYDASDLADAMLTGDLGRALRSLDGLQAEGAAEPLVLWALAEAVRNLLRLCQAQQAGRSPQQVMRELRIFSPRDRVYERALRAVPPARLVERLVRAMHQAANTDRIIKGVAPGDPWKSLETLVMTVAGAPVSLATIETGEPVV